MFRALSRKMILTAAGKTSFFPRVLDVCHFPILKNESDILLAGSVVGRNRVTVILWLPVLSSPSHILISAVGLGKPNLHLHGPRMLYLCLVILSSLSLWFPRSRKLEWPISVPSSCPHLTWNSSEVIYPDYSPVSSVSGVNLKNAKPLFHSLGQTNVSRPGLILSGK